MIIGTVIGNMWATKKDSSLTGHKLMVVVTENNKKVIATDTIGAGVGDCVLLSFGHSAHVITKSPVDAAIVGIVDSLETSNN